MASKSDDDEHSLVSTTSDTEEQRSKNDDGSSNCIPHLLSVESCYTSERRSGRTRLFAQRFSEVQIPQFVVSRLQAKVAERTRRCSQPEIHDFDEKAPMDFGLKKNKILSGPEDLRAVLQEEHLRPAAKFRLHSPDTRIPKLSTYANQAWFHGDMSREDATTFLNNRGCKEGSYLIRLSDRIPGSFVLSLAHNGAILHYPISTLKNEKGLTLLTLDGGKTKFKDLFQLVDFYEINSGQLPHVLQVQMPNGQDRRSSTST